MIKVLFVCLGNICRSPMADGVFQHMVKEHGLDDKIQVDSAGTASYHVGEPAHKGTRNVLAQHNVPYNGRARQFTRQDFETYDYILAMDKDNLYNIQQIRPNNADVVVKLFLDYADGVHIKEVPDPYYSGNFEHVYQLVHNGCIGLLKSIREKHAL